MTNTKGRAHAPANGGGAANRNKSGHGEQLALAPWYDEPFINEKEQAVLLHGWSAYEVFEGSDFVALFRGLADGPQTRLSLARRLGQDYAGDHTLRIVDELVRDDVLVAHVPDLTLAERAAAVHLMLPPAKVAGALRTRKVALVTFDADADPLRTALLESNVTLADTENEAEFTIVVATHWRDPRLRAYGARALAAGHPWMLLLLDGPITCVGPFICPPETASFECLYHRLDDNDRIGSLLFHAGHDSGQISAQPTLPQIRTLVHTAASETVRRLVLRENPNLDGRTLTFDANSWQPLTHPIRPYSDRTRRGLPLLPSTHPAPPALQSRKKLRPGYGYRTTTLEDAYERLTPLVSPLTGILRNERRLQAPSDGLLHTYVIEHNATKRTDTLDTLYLNEHTTSAGKGTSDLQARTGARYEGVERYSSLWTGREYTEVATYSELKQRGAIHPDILQGFSALQYANRMTWNASHPSPALFVPEPFDPNFPLPWVPAWSLTQARWCYVPAAFAYLGYPDEERVFCRGDSNGNAAGATLEEAIFQGFLELVERDAVSMFFYNRLRRQGVDLSSFGTHPYFEVLRAHYRETLHREVYVLDITSDLGLPTFVAISRRHDRRPEDIIMGFGTSLDAASALYRALTEMTQGLHAVLEQNPDGSTRYPDHIDSDRLDWLIHATGETHAYLMPDPNQPTRTADDYAGVRSNDDVRDDIWECVKRARRAGLEVLIVDLTREHVGCPVVKVIVPELLHWWRRLGHRRLYEVPVRMGWLAKPWDEVGLNPFSITF